MENNKDRELILVNRGKIAFLYTNDIYEQEIRFINRNSQEQWGFVFLATEIVRDLLREYDSNLFLKRYNSNFKSIALAIKKKQMEEM